MGYKCTVGKYDIYEIECSDGCVCSTCYYKNICAHCDNCIKCSNTHLECNNDMGLEYLYFDWGGAYGAI